jgi:hypothetical protein
LIFIGNGKSKINVTKTICVCAHSYNITKFWSYTSGTAKCTETDAKIKGKVLVVGVYSETREEKFVFRNRF